MYTDYKLLDINTHGSCMHTKYKLFDLWSTQSFEKPYDKAFKYVYQEYKK